MNASHPLLKAFLMETAPAGLHEVQNALLSFLWGLGWVIGPVLGGLVLEASHGDYAPLMFTTIALYLLGSGSFWFSVRSLEPERAIVPRLEPESGL
jgi:MFS family permease